MNKQLNRRKFLGMSITSVTIGGAASLLGSTFYRLNSARDQVGQILRKYFPTESLPIEVVDRFTATLKAGHGHTENAEHFETLLSIPGKQRDLERYVLQEFVVSDFGTLPSKV